MIGFIGIGFLGFAFMLASVAAWQLLGRRSDTVARRIHQMNAGSAAVMPLGDGQRSAPRSLSRLLTSAASLAPQALRGQQLRDRLAGGGFYSAEAVRLFIGTRVLLAGLLGFVSYVLLVTLHRPQSELLLFGLAAVMIGLQLPTIWLRARVMRRRQAIRLALPDAIDLLVVCVEAGLGLNAAMVRVGNEIRWSCPPLSQELRLLNQEIRAGSKRSEALRRLSVRVPIPDVQSLVAMFIQADRLGTSIGRPLRVHADHLRTKRRQRAEENARKATVKLIFPLIFFIFPELLLVILGPAGLELFETLLHMASQS